MIATTAQTIEQRLIKVQSPGFPGIAFKPQGHPPALAPYLDLHLRPISIEPEINDITEWYPGRLEQAITGL
ncbi:MAG: hypothetical protein JXA37_14530 [Chloroflexia bacterium]|nr:hypothetical protein [Chloroflexia bacterium]